MPEVKQSVTINRPVGEVFRTAMDFNRVTEWQPDIQESHLSEERPRVATMIMQRRSTRLMGWKLDLNADITNYVPNRMLEYKGVLGRFPVLGQLSFDSERGSTRVTEHLEIRMGFLYALFSPMMRGVMSRRSRKALEGLKNMIESKSVGSTPPTDFHKEL